MAARPLAPIAFRTASTTVTYRLDADGELREHDGIADDARTVVAMDDEA